MWFVKLHCQQKPRCRQKGEKIFFSYRAEMVKQRYSCEMKKQEAGFVRSKRLKNS
jgi:hypothetical protein